MAHSFENVCKIIPGASKGLEKCLEGAVYEQEKDETEANSVPGVLKKKPKLEQIFEQTIA